MHIVVLTRGSESCKRAEGKAIELARMEKAKLTFLYVICGEGFRENWEADT
jgi:nucleotide-binding universal stress UspA family protein